MTNDAWRHTGAVWPAGVPTSLTWYDIGALLHVLNFNPTRLFVEIGVEHGGLGALIASYGRYTGMIYRGIDITTEYLHPRVRDYEGHIIFQRDAWESATVDEVRGWMTAIDGPALLFCDGGNKPRELKLYAPLIRPGDILMGHDYHNEYGDDALQDMPPNVRQIQPDWLNDTLLCMFRHRDDDD